MILIFKIFFFYSVLNDKLVKEHIQPTPWLKRKVYPYPVLMKNDDLATERGRQLRPKSARKRLSAASGYQFVALRLVKPIFICAGPRHRRHVVFAKFAY